MTDDEWASLTPADQYVYVDALPRFSMSKWRIRKWEGWARPWRVWRPNFDDAVLELASFGEVQEFFANPALKSYCHVCYAEPLLPCVFRSSSRVPNRQGYFHMSRGWHD